MIEKMSIISIVANNDICDILMRCPSYQGSDYDITAETCLVGTLQDGTVKILKNSYTPKNNFIFHLSGYIHDVDSFDMDCLLKEIHSAFAGIDSNIDVLSNIEESLNNVQLEVFNK